MADPKLARIRLRHLETFLAVSRLGNLRAAAQALSVSQPAVTKTISELEEILGVRLFDRGRRGARPTVDAERFLPHASASLGALALAVQSVAGPNAPPPIRLGVLPTVAPSFVPRALLALRAVMPQADLRIESAPNRELLLQLQQRRLDVVVGRLSDPTEMAGLTFEHLYADSLALVVRPGHPLLNGPASDWSAESLLRFDLVLPTAGTIIAHSADTLLRAHGVSPVRAWVETLSVSLGRGLVRASDAVWCVPHSAVEPDLAAGWLVALPWSTQGSQEPIGLLLPNDALIPEALNSDALRALITVLRREAAGRMSQILSRP
ncbi:MAG: pcaQ [Rhizobacter sp.]|nr:pcaQ [Rhizobacter sp.]